jgi:DNA-binding response OmpR family regulator
MQDRHNVSELAEKTLRVLLVDDEPDIVSVLKQGLKLKGFEVDGFTDPRMALGQFKPDHYDFVVSDIKMPGINGFQLCRKIRERDPKAKIFLLSAFDIYEKEAESMFPTLQTEAFIKKPIRYDELAARLMRSTS